MSVALEEIARHANALLRTAEIPDYPNAINGVQVSHRGPVRALASAVDASERTIQIGRAHV